MQVRGLPCHCHHKTSQENLEGYHKMSLRILLLKELFFYVSGNKCAQNVYDLL